MSDRTRREIYDQAIELATKSIESLMARDKDPELAEVIKEFVSIHGPVHHWDYRYSADRIELDHQTAGRLSLCKSALAGVFSAQYVAHLTQTIDGWIEEMRAKQIGVSAPRYEPRKVIT